MQIVEALCLNDKKDWDPKYIICTITNEVNVIIKYVNGNNEGKVNIFTSMFGEWSLIGRTGREYAILSSSFFN